MRMEINMNYSKTSSTSHPDITNTYQSLRATLAMGLQVLLISIVLAGGFMTLSVIAVFGMTVHFVQTCKRLLFSLIFCGQKNVWPGQSIGGG